MINLSVKYMGLNLRSPLIIGSSGLTNSLSQIKKFEEKGVGAVVLKSIFEEEITAEYASIMQEAELRGWHTENIDYFDHKIREENLKRHLDLIFETKKTVFVPIIASINCTTSHEWTYFARKFEEAGADAIELNMFILPTNLDRNESETLKVYLDIINKIRKEVKIPIALKISPYFSNLASVMKQFSQTGVNALVLFNRFFNPDIDIENLELLSADVLSHSTDYLMPLRWTGLMANRIDCDIAATTGIHSGETAIKMILAGATAVQLASSIYMKGAGHLLKITDDIERWMTKKGYSKITDFKGKLAAKTSNLEAYERMQFMRYFGGYKSNA